MCYLWKMLLITSFHNQTKGSLRMLYSFNIHYSLATNPPTSKSLRVYRNFKSLLQETSEVLTWFPCSISSGFPFNNLSLSLSSLSSH